MPRLFKDGEMSGYVKSITHGGTVVWFGQYAAERLAKALETARCGERTAARDSLCRSLRSKGMCGRKKLVDVMTYAEFGLEEREFAGTLYGELVRIKAAA